MQPACVSITKAEDKPIADSYLVKLKEGADVEGHLDWIQGQSRKYTGTLYKCKVEYRYENIRGYAAYLSGPALDELTKRDDVQAIYENCEVEPETTE
ncbi:unnamed protein product [Rhizoctonia solani]|uniref:Inhibitor I9 domain-containing protein n=1 Tax=Rhizoctonia solani TaxID=456999 RepID=A0A8H2X6M8_9AGAM|nr:unnamed protein product [Rhizoctonia solani]